MASQQANPNGKLQYISHAGGPYREEDWRCTCGRMNIDIVSKCIICTMPKQTGAVVKPVQVGWECGCVVKSEPKINPMSCLTCSKCFKNKYSSSQVHQVGQSSAKPSNRFVPNIGNGIGKSGKSLTSSAFPQNPPNSPAQPDDMDVEPAKSVGFAEPDLEPVKQAKPIMPLCNCGEFEVDDIGQCIRCGKTCGKALESSQSEEYDEDAWCCACGKRNSSTSIICGNRSCLKIRKKQQADEYC